MAYSESMPNAVPSGQTDVQNSLAAHRREYAKDNGHEYSYGHSGDSAESRRLPLRRSNCRAGRADNIGHHVPGLEDKCHRRYAGQGAECVEEQDMVAHTPGRCVRRLLRSRGQPAGDV